MEVLSDVDPESLKSEHKQKSLSSDNIIKLKKSGKLKGRICDNGEPRRKFVPRKEKKSPTIILEGLSYTMDIDAY